MRPVHRKLTPHINSILELDPGPGTYSRRDGGGLGGSPASLRCLPQEFASSRMATSAVDVSATGAVGQE